MIPKRANKFSAKRTTVDGIAFDSLRESRRYSELRILERAGKIADLEPHPKFDLFAFTDRGLGFVKIGTFTPDSQYIEDGQRVVEDVKSAPTAKQADYRLRVKVFRANYPHIEFREVR